MSYDNFQNPCHFKNIPAQAKLVQTLLPQQGVPAGSNMLSIGQLLCSGFFSQDPSATWLSSVALSHGVADNQQQKEQLLRVQLSTGKGNPPISLLHQCSNTLMLASTQGQGQPIGSTTSKIGLLMFLINWLYKCPMAVTHFLQLPTNISFLVAQLSDNQNTTNKKDRLISSLYSLLLGECLIFNEDELPGSTRMELLNLISEKIGKDHFLDTLTAVAQTREFADTINRHDSLTIVEKSENLLLDRLFCSQVRKIELNVVGVFESGPREIVKKNDQENENLKREISSVNAQLEKLNQELSDLKLENETLIEKAENLEDQNLILRSNKELATNSQTEDLNPEFLTDENGDQIPNPNYDPDFVPPEPATPNSNTDPSQISNVIMQLRSEIKSKNKEILDLKQELNDTNEMNQLDMEESMKLSEKIEELEKINSQLQEDLANKCAQIVEKEVNSSSRHVSKEIASQKNSSAGDPSSQSQALANSFMPTSTGPSNLLQQEENLARQKDLENRISELEEASKLKEVSMKMNRQELAGLTVKYEQEKANNEKLTKKLQSIEANSTMNSQLEIDNLTLQVNLLNDQLEQSNENFQKIQEENLELQNLQQAWEQEKAELQRQIESQAASVADSSNESLVEELKSHISSLQSENQNLTQANSNLEGQIEMLKLASEAENNDPNTPSAEISSAAQFQIDDLSTKNMQLDSEIQELQQQLQASNSEKETYKLQLASYSQVAETLNNAKNKIDTLTADNQKLQSQIKELKDNEGILTQEKDELDKLLEEKDGELIELSGKIGENATFEATLGQYKAEISKLKNQMDEKELKIEEVNLQVRELENSLSSTKQELTSCQNSIIKWDQERVELEKKKIELEQKAVISLSSSVNSGSGSADAALKEELKQAKLELETLTKEQDDLLELLADQQTKIKDYADRLRNLDQDVTDDSEDEDDDDEDDSE